MAKDVRIKITADSKDVVKGTTSSTKAFEKLDKKIVSGSKKSVVELKKLNKQTSLLGSATAKLGAGVTAFFGANLIKKTISNLVGVNVQMFNIAAKAEGIEKAFNNINGSNLSDLREATKGTVSDLTLMQNATKGFNLGLDIKEMGSLFAFAQQRARETGVEVDYLVESITTGIGRKSPLILDNLGISAIDLKKALGGVTMEAASVADVTRAVGKIAKESLGSAADMSNNASVAVDRLASTWENMQVKGGKLLTTSNALKGNIDELNKTVVNSAPSILTFITDWGIGAAKIATTVTKLVGGYANFINYVAEHPLQRFFENFTNPFSSIDNYKKWASDQKKTTIQLAQETAKESRQIWNDSLKKRDEVLFKLEQKQSNGYTVLNFAAIEKVQDAYVAAAYKKMNTDEKLYEGSVFMAKKLEKKERLKQANLDAETKKKKDLAVVEETSLKRQIELEKEKQRIKGFTADVNTNPLFKQKNQNFGGGIFNTESQRIGDFGNLMQSETSRVGDEISQPLLTDKEKEEVRNQDIERQVEEHEKEMEQRQAYFDGATNIISSSETAMVDTIDFFANKSIETFTKMSTSVIDSVSSVLKSVDAMGGGGGLFGKGSGILGSLSIAAAGISLAGGLISALSSSSSSDSSGSSLSSDYETTASSQPTATVTKKADTINNYFSNTVQAGVIMGDQTSTDKVAMLISNSIQKQQLSLA